MKNRINVSVLFVIIIFATISGLFAQNNETQNSNVEAILTEIAEKLSIGDTARAISLFDTLPQEEAQKTELRILRANVYISAGRSQEAIQIANEIINIDKDNTEALMVLADAAAINNRERDRRNHLERVIAINPRHARALIDLGNLALAATNLRVAAQYLDRALQAEPNNGDALVSRAAVFRFQRETRQAERLLARAIELYPNWAGPYHERARLYRGSNNFNNALRDLNKANELEPFNYWVLIDRGTLLMDMNRKEDALKDFTRAIEIFPENFNAYVYSAGIKDELGDYEGAEADYLTLTRLRPTYYFAFEALGVLRMKKKEWALARDAFVSAYRHAPREYTYAFLATICWMRAGRQTDPKQFIAQVLRTVPRDSIEFTLLRMFHDLNHDRDSADRIDREQNIYTKARMAFYLASYYDIRGNQTLANRYYLLVQELDAIHTIEWRLNEWILDERGLGIRAGQNNE